MGPANIRVNGRMVVWSGWFRSVPPQALNSCPQSAFAGHHVGIGSPDAGWFDGLMNVQHDLVLGRCLHGFAVVTHHVLSMLPFAVNPAVFAMAADVTAVADIAGLDRSNTQLLT